MTSLDNGTRAASASCSVLLLAKKTVAYAVSKESAPLAALPRTFLSPRTLMIDLTVVDLIALVDPLRHGGDHRSLARAMTKHPNLSQHLSDPDTDPTVTEDTLQATIWALPTRPS
ncbi:hypothetical protein GGX14DRAFT_556905 [Mycena pura]|uniref:Uncharacterized protein n=1 Tax=Mycena pura TaxID=153505 RepID=A0AAD7E3Z1_9AGAR|nr:hypothetical protein GGX14DRAFT_556905 [Mycena pura]